MSKEFLGVGIKFPFQISVSGGIALSCYEDDIKESIQIILGTSKGERLMQPEFGCGIHDLVFEPVNTSTEGLIIHHIREALTLFEPRIEVMKVCVSKDELDVGKLLINTEYRVVSTNNVFNLVYPFYSQERGEL